ncbi:MAG: hypothetical protein ACJ76N_05140 [Thermoanaerobaculia bacterium]
MPKPWEVLGVTLTLLLIPALAAGAQPGKGSAKGDAHKPAWRWSVDERLAKRFDPESMKARAEARAAKLKDFEKRFPAPANDLFAGELKNQQNVDTIEGETNPELFLTFELFDQLLVMGFPPHSMNQKESRRLIEERAVALGFGQDLWDRLERAAAPFLKLQRREEQLARNGLLPPRSEDGTKMSPEALHWCRERARAIAAAKVEFGEEPFLRLLYAGVTPGFGVTYVLDPRAADRLRYLEGGCQ